MVTTSTLLFSQIADRELLRRCAEKAANDGGSFSVVHEFIKNDWYATYTIYWKSQETK